MKIRKVSAGVLDTQKAERALTPAQAKRMALKNDLQRAIGAADGDPSSAFQVVLDANEKPATVRLAFLRVKERTGATDVNLFIRDGGNELFIAKRPQTRGRRRSSPDT